MSSTYASYEELQKVKDARDKVIWEQMVRDAEVRIVGEELSRCYKTEGPNHFETCKELSDRYTDMLKTHKLKGVHKRSFDS